MFGLMASFLVSKYRALPDDPRSQPVQLQLATAHSLKQEQTEPRRKLTAARECFYTIPRGNVAAHKYSMLEEFIYEARINIQQQPRQHCEHPALGISRL